ncbi:MAG TPA: pseudouridine synthase, partial [Gaiellaceae bacterium]|nr:pseudouridine synthase [Gaiellaceae bacterium]
MRLNAYLARAGVASRRKADDLIKAGRVTVNGELGQLNTFVESRDRVEVDGTRVAKQPLAYLLLNKPGATVTTASDPQGRPTVVQLVPGEPRVVPVGRLDADTTGLILLTDDGELANRLMHPRFEVPKTYV